MAGTKNRFKQTVYRNQTASLTATTTSDPLVGWGDYNQLTLRVNVATVTGGGDTYDCKLQTKLGNDWVDITGAAVAQMTAADSETVIVMRSQNTTWSDQIRVVETIGAGATATLIDVTILGAIGVGYSVVPTA